MDGCDWVIAGDLGLVFCLFLFCTKVETSYHLPLASISIASPTAGRDGDKAEVILGLAPPGGDAATLLT